jgi:tetratricopeptide (TPR) repeat protein
MRGEKLSDAIVYEKLNLLKKDFVGYIGHNTEKVDANLPVFYGHVISALENSFPDILDESYDDFIDLITFEVLNASRNIGDFTYISRVIQNALRYKKRKDAETGINIVVGLKLVKIGDYAHAIDFLKKYCTLDTKIGTALAYSYYALSLLDFRKNGSSVESQRPGEMELLARETLLTLAHAPAPINLVKQLELDDPTFLERIFWQMIFLGLEWFPSERWFIEAGLENATLMHNTDMRKRLLDISSERFYNDIHFLRVMFYYYLDSRDAGGAAGVLNHLIRQYPDDLEPIYLGLKFSLLTKKKITYHSFRKLANSKGMPAPIVYLFDVTFDLLNREKPNALSCIAEFEKEFPLLKYYITTLRYLSDDFFSPDEAQAKKAKKAFLDSVDQYCGEELKKTLPLSTISTQE